MQLRLLKLFIRMLISTLIFSCRGLSFKKTRNFSRCTKTKLFVKRKTAICVGYVGTDWLGLQADDEFTLPTIERELEEAMAKAGAIMDSNRCDLKKIGWSRSSRTDKGVHATKTIISAKLALEDADIDPGSFDRPDHLPSYDGFVSRVNAHLPKSIRVFSVSKASKSFNARGSCSYREYEYLLPLEYFSIGDEGRVPDWRVSSCADAQVVWDTAGDDGVPLADAIVSILGHTIGSSSTLQTAMQRVSAFDETLRLYEGAKSFHNFHRISGRTLRRQKDVHRGSDGAEELGSPEPITISKGGSAHLLGQPDPKTGVSRPLYDDWTVATAKRRLLDEKLSCIVYRCRVTGLLQTPPTDASSGLMVKVSIVGQSFLLHMIRLMVGGALAVATDILPKEVIRAALKSDVEIPLPMAPAHGLVLQGSAFLGTPSGRPYLFPPLPNTNSGGSSPGTTVVARGTQYLTTQEAMQISEDFKLKHIYPQVASDWSAELSNMTDDASTGRAPPYCSWLRHIMYRYSPVDPEKLAREVATAPTKDTVRGKATKDGTQLPTKDEREYARVLNCLDKARALRDGRSEGRPFRVKQFFPNGMTTALHIRCGTLPGQNPYLAPAMRAFASAMVAGDVIPGLSTEDAVDNILGASSDERCCLDSLKEWATRPYLEVIM